MQRTPFVEFNGEMAPVYLVDFCYLFEISEKHTSSAKSRTSLPTTAMPCSLPKMDDAEWGKPEQSDLPTHVHREGRQPHDSFTVLAPFGTPAVCSWIC